MDDLLLCETPGEIADWSDEDWEDYQSVSLTPLVDLPINMENA
jgi:hypothetical protein